MGIGVTNRIIRPLELWWKSLVLSAVRETDPFVIVTGADRTHFKSLLNLLASLKKWEPEVPVVAYDLGLENDQREILISSFPSAIHRRFDYSKYPEYFNIRVNKGQFAWKPVIFSEVMEEYRCIVCWFDAGNLAVGRLTRLRRVAQLTGFYSPYAKGNVRIWTHPSTLAYMKVAPSILTKRTMAGYCVAANYRSPKARRLVERWKECALVKECIAPEGSDQYNHRQDLSVLTVLVYQVGLPLFMSNFRLDIKCQQDVD